MKIRKPEIEFLGEVPTDYEGNLTWIERAGRTCYKSESKGNPEKFVRKLITSGHLAMVEHSNFVVRTRWQQVDPGKYLTLHRDPTYTYVGGNLVAWVNRMKGARRSEFVQPFYDIYTNLFNAEYRKIHSRWELCPHDEIPNSLRLYSVKFICDRGVSHELVRHRPCSFAQESTRYVNYGGKDMEFIEPAGFEAWPAFGKVVFDRDCRAAEEVYALLLEEGLKPQQARAVLPNALKTEIIVTANAAEWAHIKKLRTAKDAHPDIQRVMNMVPWEKIL